MGEARQVATTDKLEASAVDPAAKLLTQWGVAAKPTISHGVGLVAMAGSNKFSSNHCTTGGALPPAVAGSLARLAMGVEQKITSKADQAVLASTFLVALHPVDGLAAMLYSKSLEVGRPIQVETGAKIHTINGAELLVP